MVRAISSAMDSSVFLNSSKPMGSESRVATAQTSITMLPESSSRARAPGGTTHVASYSSTIAGPCARRREIGAGEDRRHDPAVARTEVHAPRAPERARGPADLHALGNARPVAQSLADDAQAHDLDRLVGAGAMPVGALVLARRTPSSIATRSRVTGTVSSNDWPW